MSVSFSRVTGWRVHVLRACAPFAAAVSLVSCGSVPAKPGADASVGDTSTEDAAIDAPPKACTTTTCTNDVLEVCGSNGMVESTEPCALGCFTDATRCNAVDPSNGLASHLDQAAQQGDVTLPDGSTINTDNGTVMSPNGPVAVATATVAQSAGPMLRVLIAKSFTLGDVRVTGALPLAMVASEEITINGVVDASADGSSGGPGAQSCGAMGAGGAPGNGHYERPRAGNSGGYPTYIWCINGAGGGGFGTAGGNGGTQDQGMTAVGSGGIANGQAALVPLRGGCPGYAATASYVGAGGGALQLVSNKAVKLVDTGASKGILHVGGGGARAGTLGKPATDDPTPMYGPAGGGSGGGILIEAPVLVLEDGTALLAAGGGGGGYGACANAPNGMNAPASATTPTGGACPAGTSPATSGGNGAISATGGVGTDTTVGGSGGGGGGGLGRIRVNTADGQYTSGTGAVVTGAATTGTVGTR